MTDDGQYSYSVLSTVDYFKIIFFDFWFYVASLIVHLSIFFFTNTNVFKIFISIKISLIAACLYPLTFLQLYGHTEFVALP